MRMQKGLCIELNENRSIFLLPNGQFIQGSPAGETAVGEENYFYPYTRKAWIKWNPVFAPIIAALAVAALFFSVLLPAQEAFAYVQVEVNPSVELGVDKNYDVISLRPLNSDGRELIDKLEDWENHSLDDILNRVIALSLKESTEEITITTVSGNQEEAVVKMVMAVSANVLEKNISVNLKEATKEQWRKSVKESVPVGNLIGNSTPVQGDSKIESETDVPKKQEIEEKEKIPSAKDKKKEPAAEEKKKNDPPGQEKRKKIPGQEKKKNDPPAKEKKNKEAGQDKKKNDPPAKEKKNKAPGQEKKKNDSPGNNKKNKER